MIKRLARRIKRALGLAFASSIERGYSNLETQIEIIRQLVDTSADADDAVEKQINELEEQVELWRRRSKEASDRANHDLAAQALARREELLHSAAKLRRGTKERARRTLLLRRNLADLESITIRVWLLKTLLALFPKEDNADTLLYVGLIEAFYLRIKTGWQVAEQQDKQELAADLKARLADLEGRVMDSFRGLSTKGESLDKTRLSQSYEEIKTVLAERQLEASKRKATLLRLEAHLVLSSGSSDEETFRVSLLEKQQLRTLELTFEPALQNLVAIEALLTEIQAAGP